ncbi:ABC transporter ATP-binding protein [Thermopolyspora sp. NPDC052614]|uniref:ABC transporter ATP-binding protein n=1 Tax=Thermopolyspora sp. NPDC052614 TaxID=3155682 RepID=UPI00343C0117
MTALEMAGVVAGYGDARVLDGVSLSVADGEMVCLIGPNGAGKSTCLKVVMGLLPWTGGEVRLGGVPVPSGGAPDGGRAALGYVPQVRNTFPSLSVRENLLVMTPRQWSRATAERRVGELLGDFPQLAEMSGRSAALLSGGERQLLALAMALVRRPAVLLLDEPSAALSPLAANQVFEIVARLKEGGIGVLVVEQNARLALAVSDRCYVLEAGRVALEGPASRLLDDPRLGALYLGGDLPHDHGPSEYLEGGPAEGDARRASAAATRPGSAGES